MIYSKPPEHRKIIFTDSQINEMEDRIKENMVLMKQSSRGNISLALINQGLRMLIEFGHTYDCMIYLKDNPYEEEKENKIREKEGYKTCE